MCSSVDAMPPQSPTTAIHLLSAGVRPFFDRIELQPAEDRRWNARERPAADECDDREYERDQTFLACGGSTRRPSELLRTTGGLIRRRER